MLIGWWNVELSHRVQVLQVHVQRYWAQLELWPCLLRLVGAPYHFLAYVKWTLHLHLSLTTDAAKKLANMPKTMRKRPKTKKKKTTKI